MRCGVWGMGIRGMRYEAWSMGYEAWSLGYWNMGYGVWGMGIWVCVWDKYFIRVMNYVLVIG